MILKINAGRAKDRNDIAVLMQHSRPDAIFKRLATLWGPNRRNPAIIETLDRVIDVYEETSWQIDPVWFAGVPVEILKQWSDRLILRTNQPDFLKEVAHHVTHAAATPPPNPRVAARSIGPAGATSATIPANNATGSPSPAGATDGRPGDRPTGDCRETDIGAIPVLSRTTRHRTPAS
jgi:hypothetical protein